MEILYSQEQLQDSFFRASDVDKDDELILSLLDGHMIGNTQLFQLNGLPSSFRKGGNLLNAGGHTYMINGASTLNICIGDGKHNFCKLNQSPCDSWSISSLSVEDSPISKALNAYQRKALSFWEEERCDYLELTLKREI